MAGAESIHHKRTHQIKRGHNSRKCSDAVQHKLNKFYPSPLKIQITKVGAFLRHSVHATCTELGYQLLTHYFQKEVTKALNDRPNTIVIIYIAHAQYAVGFARSTVFG